MRMIVAITVMGVALAACDRGGNRNQSAGPTSGNGPFSPAPATIDPPAPVPVPPPRPGLDTESSADQSNRNTFRTIGIQSCIGAAQSRARAGGGAPLNTDFRPACTCYMDRVMAGKSTQELINLRPGQAEREVAEQCARELGL